MHSRKCRPKPNPQTQHRAAHSGVPTLAVNKEMIEINELESKYLDLMEGKISIKEFERWVYSSKWLEIELSENEYTDLISLNYNTPSSKYEIRKILKERFDEGKFEAIKIIHLLDSIIDRDGNEEASLMRMYDLYCKGYYFLEDLGLESNRKR